MVAKPVLIMARVRSFIAFLATLSCEFRDALLRSDCFGMLKCSFTIKDGRDPGFSESPCVVCMRYDSPPAPLLSAAGRRAAGNALPLLRASRTNSYRHTQSIAAIP